MKKMAVEQAIGQILCHDLTAILDNGFKGVLFRRGHVIKTEDIPALKDIGKNHVFIWEPEADEVHEDDAALAIVNAICGKNLQWSEPSEGKVQISTQIDGLLRINRQALREINRVPDYTVSCLPGNSPVLRGQKLAAARIVPLVTAKSNVDQATVIAAQYYPVISVQPFRPLKCGLIITGNEIFEGRIVDRFEPILTKKLSTFGAKILGAIICPDDPARILDAINGFRARGAELILLTGGMSVDPDDSTPDAIRQSGADVITYGIAMQPGNMLMLASLEETMLVGVPGASLHFRTTSLDIFLPRIFAGDTITPEEIADFGEGGFCMQCEKCHYPICYFGRR